MDTTSSDLRIHEVFIASSLDEFDRERKHIGASVLALNDRIIDGDDYVRLFLCEDRSKAMNPKRKQDEYNQRIERSNLMLIIAGRRIGKYTVEEFEAALRSRAETGFPKIVALIKDGERTDDVEAGGLTTDALMERLVEENVVIKNFSTLDELDSRLMDDDVFGSLLRRNCESVSI